MAHAFEQVAQQPHRERGVVDDEHARAVKARVGRLRGAVLFLQDAERRGEVECVEALPEGDVCLARIRGRQPAADALCQREGNGIVDFHCGHEVGELPVVVRFARGCGRGFRGGLGVKEWQPAQAGHRAHQAEADRHELVVSHFAQAQDLQGLRFIGSAGIRRVAGRAFLLAQRLLQIEQAGCDVGHPQVAEVAAQVVHALEGGAQVRAAQRVAGGVHLPEPCDRDVRKQVVQHRRIPAAALDRPRKVASRKRRDRQAHEIGVCPGVCPGFRGGEGGAEGAVDGGEDVGGAKGLGEDVGLGAHGDAAGGDFRAGAGGHGDQLAPLPGKDRVHAAHGLDPVDFLHDKVHEDDVEPAGRGAQPLDGFRAAAGRGDLHAGALEDSPQDLARRLGVVGDERAPPGQDSTFNGRIHQNASACFGPALPS